MASKAIGTTRIVSPVAGGEYQSYPMGNGNYAILNVPILGEVELTLTDENGKQIEVDIDREWLTAACMRAHERIESGYAPPIHREHQEEGLAPSKKLCGYMVGHRLLEVDGEAFVHVDFVEVFPEEYAALQAKRLPYRSAELGDARIPEISSLALLESKVPQFKLPLTTVKEVQTSGRGYPLVFQELRRGGDIMAEEKDKLKVPPKAPPKAEDKSKAKAKEPADTNSDGRDSGKRLTVVEETVTKMSGQMAEILEMFSKRQSEAGTPEPAAAPAEAVAVEATAFAAMEGRLVKLETSHSTLSRDRAIDAAVVELRALNVAFNEESFRERAVYFHEKGVPPSVYGKEIAEHAPKAPDGGGTVLPGADTLDSSDEDLEEYKGDEREVAKFHANFYDNTKVGKVSNIDRATFIATKVRAWRREPQEA